MNDTLFVCGTCGSAFWGERQAHLEWEHGALLGQAAAFQGRHWNILRKDYRVSLHDRRQKIESGHHVVERREEALSASARDSILY